jgi:hypothetical protein
LFGRVVLRGRGGWWAVWSPPIVGRWWSVLAGCGDGEIWLEGKGKEDDEEGRRGGCGH